MKNHFVNKDTGRPGKREAVSTSIRWFSILSFIAILCISIIPTRDVHALTELDMFVEQVKNGQADQLRGIYIPGILSAPVVQQPSARDDFVSPRQNIVTQFSMASKVGSTGLLAHNYLAGKSFALLKGGQEFYLVYGDGRVIHFTVLEVLQYEALEPDSASSTFVDLKSGSALTYSALFLEVYNRPGQVILQTCIEKDNEPSWGRLFVIAEPVLD
jgi:hypothetical protein